jgi:hypothetical protein
MNTKSLFLVSALAFTLVGCSSGLKDFTRLDNNQINLGQTTRAEVVSKIREPKSTGKRLINGEMVDVMEFGYMGNNADSDTEGPGYLPVKTQFFFIGKDDKVIGTEYYSSFKSDSTRFNIDNIAKISKGVTSKKEVIELLGSPSIQMIPPLVKAPAVSAIGYHHRTMSLLARSLHTTANKLIVSFDANNIVSDVNYESTTN